MSERRMIYAGGAALLAIGLALRCLHLFTMPFWLDEAYSAYAAGKGFGFLWRVVPYYETHPPFYYSLLALWEQLFGDSLISLRASSLLASLLTLPALAWCGDAIGRVLDWRGKARARLAFAALGLGCVAIGLVEMAREVRTYALMILVYTLATRALLGILARRRAGLPIAGRAYAGYLLALEALLWLHDLGPLWAAALGISCLIAVLDRRTTRRDLGWIAGGHALAFLIWLPGLRITLDQAPTWIASTWVRFTLDATWLRLGAIYAVPSGWSVAGLVLVLLAVAGLRRTDGGGRIVAILLILALLPVLLSIGISAAIAPVFITRTLTPAGAPTLLLFAIGATAWGRPIGWIGAGAALLLGASMAAVGVQNRTYEPQRQDWYGTVAWLRQRFRPGDQIFAYPNEGAMPMVRALKDEGLDWPIRPIPAAVPAMGWGDWHPTGNRGVVSLQRPALRRIAQEARTRAVPTIWLLRLGRETYDPGDVLLSELHAGRQVVRSWLSGPISIVGLARAGEPAAPTLSDPSGKRTAKAGPR